MLPMNSAAPASAKKLFIIAGLLLTISALSFATGAVLLGVGIMAGGGAVEEPDPGVTDTAGGDPAAPAPVPAPQPSTPAPKQPGFFERIFGGGDDVEKPRFAGKRPIGLYLMTKYWFATRHLEKAVWYFTSDGRVYYNPEGVSAEDLAARSEKHGTVTVEGDELVATWSDGSVSRGDIEVEETGFNWDTGIFAPVERFTDAQHLHGRWEGGTSMSFGGGSTTASRTLDIRPDGTFDQSSAATIQSESDESVASAGSSGATSGRWRLDGYTLTLTYGDGKVVRSICFPFDDEKTPVFPDRFYFGRTLYKKLG